MNCVSGTCDFDGGFCEWINLPLGDEFDWALNSGKTGTILTGPEKDHTGHDGKNTCFLFSLTTLPGMVILNYLILSYSEVTCEDFRSLVTILLFCFSASILLWPSRCCNVSKVYLDMTTVAV